MNNYALDALKDNILHYSKTIKQDKQVYVLYDWSQFCKLWKITTEDLNEFQKFLDSNKDIVKWQWINKVKDLEFTIYNGVPWEGKSLTLSFKER